MRLFVAADLTPEVRAALPTTGAPEKLHVTLVFLGSPAEVPVLDLSPPHAPLRVTDVIRLGRVVAAGLWDQTGAWTAYRAALAEALGVAQARPWRPHITLSRRRRFLEVEPVSFIPPGVTLYRSAGGRYEALARLLAPRPDAQA